ncbi:hypothetical protein [Eubacterium limosum]|uniref:hypothetical protein n=2 Tax=Eubacterium limosum TaxID=1736 RepID=UPI001FA82785|nr:hypothetical protein [Eubacterium limosum]
MKMRNKYIPKSLCADGKQYEMKEIKEVRNGFIRCGSPGLRYLVITDKKTQSCFSTTGPNAGQPLSVTLRERKKKYSMI